MDDLVVSFIESALLANGVTTVKFNFRGVGASEGDHDKGIGEVEDLVFLADLLRVEGDITQLIICGYSFGAIVALDAIQRTSCELAILVAPPVAMLGSKSLAPPDKPSLVILGERDDIVDASATGTWFTENPNQTAGSVELVVVEGADHFFPGAGNRIESLVSSFVTNHLPQSEDVGD